jgi:N-acetylglucosamine-6-sulfatase
MAAVLSVMGSVLVSGTVHDAIGSLPQRPGPVDRGRPNVVVVMADDMRVDDLRFAPRLRRIVAHHGVSFENSFSPFPLCCPARASLLTGMYAHNHGVLSHELPYGYGAFDDSRTLATSMRRAGYTTGFVGKYLNRYGIALAKTTGRPSYRHVPPGWDRWVGALENPGRGDIHGSAYNYFDTPYNVNGRIDNRYAGRYQTSVVGDFSVDMARRFSRRQRPFFMYVNFVAPHHGGPAEPDDPRPWVGRTGGPRDYVTPARPGWVRGRFDDVVPRGAGLPRHGRDPEADLSDKPAGLARRPPIGPAARRSLREVTRQRAEAIFVMDREIARLVRVLKTTGEWRDTVFVFTSDNGYFQGEHRLRQGKVFAYEPSLRVPLLVTGPGLREGTKRYDPISTVDLAATILDLGGARPPRPGDGTSKVDTLLRGDLGWRVPVVTEAVGTSPGGNKWPGARTSIGLRTAYYSYTRYRNGQAELYDLRRDPLQLRSVHDDPDYRSVRRLLRATRERFRNCAAEQCRATLAARLRATAEENRSATTAYWRVMERVYGW